MDGKYVQISIASQAGRMPATGRGRRGTRAASPRWSALAHGSSGTSCAFHAFLRLASTKHGTRARTVASWPSPPPHPPLNARLMPPPPQMPPPPRDRTLRRMPRDRLSKRPRCSPTRPAIAPYSCMQPCRHAGGSQVQGAAQLVFVGRRLPRSGAGAKTVCKSRRHKRQARDKGMDKKARSKEAKGVNLGQDSLWRLGDGARRRKRSAIPCGDRRRHLLKLGATGTLECADGVTGDHGPAGHEHEDSEGASTLRHRLGPRWP